MCCFDSLGIKGHHQISSTRLAFQDTFLSLISNSRFSSVSKGTALWLRLWDLLASETVQFPVPPQLDGATCIFLRNRNSFFKAASAASINTIPRLVQHYLPTQSQYYSNTLIQYKDKKSEYSVNTFSLQYYFPTLWYNNR